MQVVSFILLQDQVMQRNSAAFTATTKVADIPSDVVKPGVVEVVLDIIKDYSRKLDFSVFGAQLSCLTVIQSSYANP